MIISKILFTMIGCWSRHPVKHNNRILIRLDGSKEEKSFKVGIWRNNPPINFIVWENRLSVLVAGKHAKYNFHRRQLFGGLGKRETTMVEIIIQTKDSYETVDRNKGKKMAFKVRGAASAKAERKRSITWDREVRQIYLYCTNLDRLGYAGAGKKTRPKSWRHPMIKIYFLCRLGSQIYHPWSSISSKSGSRDNSACTGYSGLPARSLS